MCMLIWVNVDESEEETETINRKIALNWLLTFAVATKHYIRGESGQSFGDTNKLLSNLKILQFDDTDFLFNSKMLIKFLFL
jgi:hypothetical protein